jgi:HSP20 family molecular chaperone IbpA
MNYVNLGKTSSELAVIKYRCTKVSRRIKPPWWLALASADSDKSASDAPSAQHPKEGVMKSQKASPRQQPEPPATLLSRRNPADLRWEMQEVQLAIARRAYELFETRGCEHGHDWEDWFRAESELLRPVSLTMTERGDRISVRANVFGFEKNELRVSIEPRCITILGKKEVSVTESEGGKLEYIDWYPELILKRIELATEVIPESSVAELQAGVLKFELPTAATNEFETAPAA